MMKKRIFKNLISVLIPLMMLAGCHAHTGVEVRSLPHRAAIKIEAGVTITVCNAANQCIRNFDLVSMGSGVIISHHRDSSFILTAGHVCEAPGQLRPPLMATTPELQAILNQVARRIGAPEGFEPVIASMDWTINIRDTNLREYPTKIINVDPPGMTPGDLDLCLAASPRINAQAARISTTLPERGSRVYNIS